MSIRSNTVKGVTWTTAATVGRSFFQLIQIAILARFLPKEAFGLVAMALFVLDLSFVFVDMGISSAILHRKESTQQEYSSIYWLNIFASTLIYSVIFLSSPFVSEFYQQPDLEILIPIIGINLIALAIGRQHRTIMQKEFRFKEIAICELFSYFVGLLSAVLFAVWGFEIYSLVYSTLISSFLSNLLFFSLNFRLNPILFHFRISETKPFLKIGGFTMGSALLDFSSREIDVLIIGRMLGAESLGAYSLSKQIVLKVYHLINPIVLNVLNPLLASIQNERVHLKRIYLQVVQSLTLINLPIYLLIIIASKEILVLLYGENYSDYFGVLSLLAFSYFLSSISNPVGSLQIATGRTDLGFKWTLFRTFFTIPVIILGALVSIETVALSISILSLFFVFPIWYVQLKPMINVAFSEYLEKFFRPVCFLFLTVCCFYFFFEILQLNESLFVSVFVKSAIGLICILSYFVVFEKNVVQDLFFNSIRRRTRTE